MTEDEIKAKIEYGKSQSRKRADAVRAKQNRVLLAAARIAVYSFEVDHAIDIATCPAEQFERHMRSRNRIDRATVKICKMAVRYNVSALKNLTVKVGNEFLNFWVWGEYNGIPFTLEDMQLLEQIKTQSIDRFIAATRKCDRVQYAIERIVSGSYLEGDAVRCIETTRDVVLGNNAADAAWVDFEVLRPDFTTEHALNAGFNPKERRFHREPEPGDEVKITTMRINTYKNFDQKLESFAPIPHRTFVVFIVEPIPPADVV